MCEWAFPCSSLTSHLPMLCEVMWMKGRGVMITPWTLEGIQHSREEIGCKEWVDVPHSMNTPWTCICTQKQIHREIYPHMWLCINILLIILYISIQCLVQQGLWNDINPSELFTDVCERESVLGGKYGMWYALLSAPTQTNAHPWTKMQLHTHTDTHTKPDREITENLKWTSSHWVFNPQRFSSFLKSNCYQDNWA